VQTIKATAHRGRTCVYILYLSRVAELRISAVFVQSAG